MITFSGIQITKEFGAPCIRDVAVQSMRESRFNGATRLYWTVGMHQLFTADIVSDYLQRPDLEAYALVHDAGEACGIGDICQPMKVAEQRALEHILRDRFYDLIGLPRMTQEQEHVVKFADDIAVMAEGTVLGLIGFKETQPDFHLCAWAIDKMGDYLPLCLGDVIDPDGLWPLEYERRLREALARINPPVTARKWEPL